MSGQNGRPAIRCGLLVACLVVLGGMILLIVRPRLDPLHVARLPLVAAAWAAFGVAAWLLRKVTGKLAAGLILAGGIALQLVAISGPPATSTDLYRYLWDGRVQAAGIDPYLYPPAAAGVAGLRYDFLWAPWSATPARSRGYDSCPVSRTSRQGAAFDQVAGCAKINRANVPTIYPPVAEAYFLAVHLAAPADDGTLPVQAAGAGCAVLTALTLLLGLRRLGRDPRLTALWAWCPTVALEAGNNAHVDVLAVLLTAISLLVLARARTEGRAMLGGALLGLAIAAKVTPVLVVPGVLRRAWEHIVVAAGAAITVVYAPHVLAVGRKVIGFLPGYLQQQGYSTGTGFDIIGLVARGRLATVVAVALLGLVALAILRWGDPGEPWRGGVLMTSAALVICTPRFQWYAILLVMLVALDGRPEWLALPAGSYLASDARLSSTVVLPHARVLGYGGGAAVAVALAVVRYLRSRRAARAGTRPYRVLTPAAMPEHRRLARPSMEVCDTTTPSMPSIPAPGELAGSAPRGTPRTTTISAAPVPASSPPRPTDSRPSTAGSIR